MSKSTRPQLKKDFFAGNISATEFKSALKEAIRYRGYHWKPGKRPKWSGPFRDFKTEATSDNAPFYDSGYSIDIYEE